MNPTVIETHQFEWKLSNFTKETFEAIKKKPLPIWHIKNIPILQAEDLPNFVIFKSNYFEGCFITHASDSHLTLNFFLKSKDFDTQAKITCWIPGREGTKQEYQKVILRNTFPREEMKFLDVAKVFAEPAIYLGKDNSLTFKIGLVLSKKSSKISQPATDNSRFFLSNRFSDVKFICSDNVKLPAHRVILSNNSQVMDGKLNDIKECPNIVVDSGFSSDIMREVLRFLYTRKVENLQTLATKILCAAEKYKLEELKAICVLWMAQNLTTENVIDYFVMAAKYNQDYLLSKCANFIKPNYHQMRQHPSWMQMNGNLLQILLDLFEKDTRNIHYISTTFYGMGFFELSESRCDDGKFDLFKISVTCGFIAIIH